MTESSFILGQVEQPPLVLTVRGSSSLGYPHMYQRGGRVGQTMNINVESDASVFYYVEVPSMDDVEVPPQDDIEVPPQADTQVHDLDDTKVVAQGDANLYINTDGQFSKEPNDPTLLTRYVNYVTFRLWQGEV